MSSDQQETYLAGSVKFKVKEIEVFTFVWQEIDKPTLDIKAKQFELYFHLAYKKKESLNYYSFLYFHVK